ncbi:metallophosphoesterase family protein [Deinococcus cellulosilyticus]|uniref:Calcineurin-like phosphoesterase domain-containing protein n=1 Tax=Deinococcus cellulosilyticus (strain DSM 18568 / NBRC 106333 / KACC 11606 / 5516J-15) TaxID=1223518 RepID=A0A511MYA9_DEIC1|nr:metallophosphoesterase family protein [Deinococcus cellulosilyticus]GEM45126.1 hypothetical protein DC3_07610 [Deinococcus cellulosilyticus NBRC 106333 = KACC 11606]
MKIAVLSDIHGNLQAFEAVLNDAKDADQIILLGDNVNWGMHSPEVLQRIQSKNVQTLKGNHEIMLLDHLTGQAPVEAYTSDSFAPARFWAGQLAGWKEVIESWPGTLTLSFSGLPDLYFCHASPRSAFDEILLKSDSELKALCQEVKAPFLFAGHTHRQMLKNLGRKTLCTVGSVGFPVDGTSEASYVMLHGQQGKWNIEFRKTVYDLEAFHHSYHESGFLQQTGVIGTLIYLGALLGRSTLREFGRYRNRHALERALDLPLLLEFLQHELTPREIHTLMQNRHTPHEVLQGLKRASSIVL